MVQETRKNGGRSGKLYTLTDVAKATGISMPTLQRYKRLYQSRIPSEGRGRKQRFPREALKVFEQLKKENLSKRGRPAKKKAASSKRKAGTTGRTYARKTASSRKSAKKATKRRPATGTRRAASSDEGYITLTEVGKRTGISYPTLLRYVKMHLRRIPHKGTGRTRRFKPEAVAIFEQLRKDSPRGRRKGSGKGVAARAGNARDRSLELKLRKLEKQVQALEKVVRKPLKVTIAGR